MSEKIKVRINADGVTATEVNKFGKKPQPYHHVYNKEEYIVDKMLKDWQESESKLRMFEIEKVNSADGNTFYATYNWEYNKIYEAKVIDNNKLTIKIL